MTSPLILPDPGCSFGYPLGQVAEILGSEEAVGEFWLWAKRQRRLVGYCAGYDFRVNVEAGTVERVKCSAVHGFVIYRDDLTGFLQQAAA